MDHRAELIRRIRRRAKAVGLTFQIEREGKEHELWRCGSTVVAMPRHRDINRRTAERTFKDLERELGEGWWRDS